MGPARTLAVLFLALACVPAAAAADLEALAARALAGGPGADSAAAELRRAGETGSDIITPLLSAFAACPDCDPEALDRLCGVRDCDRIRLFWHTDLGTALAVARREGKPVLSLRLLGRLDEELSCANSRFFRTVYYADEEIGRLLAERYVLHWRSMRPVPKVSIDFGDGRLLERTLVGNSLHYVLDERGRVIEVLPGLSGPDEFRRRLVEGRRHAREAAAVGDDLFPIWALDRYQERHDEIREALERDRGPLAQADRDPWALTIQEDGVLTDRINVGLPDTGSKAVFSAPVLEALQAPGRETLAEMAVVDDHQVRLSPSSRAFLRAKHGVALGPEADRLIESFEATLALDELINRYRMEPPILERLFATAIAGPPDLEELSAWIYREVFEQPLDDPWLGLAPREIYGALPPEMLAGGE
jgi:hypothetical protein